MEIVYVLNKGHSTGLLLSLHTGLKHYSVVIYVVSPLLHLLSG